MQFVTPQSNYDPRGQAGPPREDLPYFDTRTNTLKIPPGAAMRGIEMKAFQPQLAEPVTEPGAISDAQIKQAVRDVLKNDTQKTARDGTSIWEEISHKVREEIKNNDREAEKKFNNMWFDLKPNTFSTAIWTLLVLDLDALDYSSLFKSPNSNEVEYSQRWRIESNWDYLLWPFQFWRKRLWPLISAGFFLFVSIFLFMVTVGIQIGFSLLLYNSLEMPDFAQDGVEYVCATTGWLQLISIGFFISYMLGELPRLIQVFFLICTSQFETTQERGESEAKRLYEETTQERGESEAKRLYEQTSELGFIDDVEDIDEWWRNEIVGASVDSPVGAPAPPAHQVEDYCHRRSKGWLNFRRFFALIVNLCDVGVTGFVLFVGVQYIFWVGYKSNDPSYVDRRGLPSGEQDWVDGGFPWMSNTSGIEEVLMATLALVFIMDIDEILFRFMLPKSVQQVVLDCRLSSVMWMPSSFEADEFRRLGFPLDTDAYASFGWERPSPADLEKSIKKFTKRFDDQSDELAKINDQLKEGRSSLKRKQIYYEKSHLKVKSDQLKIFKPLRDHCKQFLESLKDKKPTVAEAKGFRAEFDKAIADSKAQTLTSSFNATWMALMPFFTVGWIVMMIFLAFAVVIMVRHHVGCAEFASEEMPDMPAPAKKESSPWSDSGAYSLAVIPGGILVLFALIIFVEHYVLDIMFRSFPVPERFRSTSNDQEAADEMWYAQQPTQRAPQMNPLDTINNAPPIRNGSQPDLNGGPRYNISTNIVYGRPQVPGGFQPSGDPGYGMPGMGQRGHRTLQFAGGM